MYHNSHSEGTCVLLEIPSMHKLAQYFQTGHMNEDIYIYELKGVHIATFEAHHFSSSVEHCSISNVNSYQCSCKQCSSLPVNFSFSLAKTFIFQSFGLESLP